MNWDIENQLVYIIGTHLKAELVPTTDSEILNCAPSYTNLALRSDSNASSSQPSVKVFCEEDAKGLYYKRIIPNLNAFSK